MLTVTGEERGTFSKRVSLKSPALFFFRALFMAMLLILRICYVIHPPKILVRYNSSTHISFNLKSGVTWEGQCFDLGYLFVLFVVELSRAS